MQVLLVKISSIWSRRADSFAQIISEFEHVNFVITAIGKQLWFGRASEIRLAFDKSMIRYKLTDSDIGKKVRVWRGENQIEGMSMEMSGAVDSLSEIATIQHVIKFSNIPAIPATPADSTLMRDKNSSRKKDE